MAEQYNVRAVEIEAAGFNPVHGEAIIRARLSGGEELQLAFPADDIPRLMFLLSHPYSQHIAQSGGPSRQALVVDSAQFQRVTEAGTILFSCQLEAGVPLALSIPLPTAAALCEQLSGLLE